MLLNDFDDIDKNLADSAELFKIIKELRVIEEQFDFFKNKFEEKKIPRPQEWGGYCLVPDYIEFWQGRKNRLHDRIVYKKMSRSDFVRNIASNLTQI